MPNTKLHEMTTPNVQREFMTRPFECINMRVAQELQDNRIVYLVEHVPADDKLGRFSTPTSKCLPTSVIKEGHIEALGLASTTLYTCISKLCKWH